MASLLTSFKYLDSSGSTYELDDDLLSATIKLGIDIKNNNATIKLKNKPIDLLSDGSVRHKWVNSAGENYFKIINTKKGLTIPEEVIKVYGLWTDTNPSQDIETYSNILFNGIINECEVESTEKEYPISLKAVDRNAVILNKLAIPQKFKKSDSKTAPLLIQQLVRNSAINQTSTAEGYDSNGNLSNGYPFLIDARLFSEGVKSTGTATSTATNKLIDTSATFQTDDVEVGDWVRNNDTNEYAYVSSVDSETQLTLNADIFTDTDSYSVSNGFIQDKRNDGSNFPSIPFSNINKPVIEVISNLSQVESTNSESEVDNLVIKRGMRFFIDVRNRFHWFEPTDTPSYIMEVGNISAISPDTKAHKIFNVSMKKTHEDNINFLIFKCGEDMDNVMIKGFSRAPFSGTPQAKESFRDWSDIARMMKIEEEQEGNISKTKGDEYSYPSSYNPLPNGDSYPAWDSIKDTIPTSDSEYNSLFEREAIRRGRIRAMSIFQALSNPRWKGKITLLGEQIQVGDLVKFTNRIQGIRNVLLRVNKVLHSFSKSNGWITTIEVEEDEIEAKGV